MDASEGSVKSSVKTSPYEPCKKLVKRKRYIISDLIQENGSGNLTGDFSVVNSRVIASLSTLFPTKPRI